MAENSEKTVSEDVRTINFHVARSTVIFILSLVAMSKTEPTIFCTPSSLLKLKTDGNNCL